MKTPEDIKTCNNCKWGTTRNESEIIGGQMTFLGRIPCKRIWRTWIDCGIEPEIHRRDPDSVCERWEAK
jgi:hypothetical protein